MYFISDYFHLLTVFLIAFIILKNKTGKKLWNEKITFANNIEHASKKKKKKRFAKISRVFVRSFVHSFIRLLFLPMVVA